MYYGRYIIKYNFIMSKKITICLSDTECKFLDVLLKRYGGKPSTMFKFLLQTKAEKILKYQGLKIL